MLVYSWGLKHVLGWMGRTQFLVGGAGMFSPYGDGNYISGGMMYLTRLFFMALPLPHPLSWWSSGNFLVMVIEIVLVVVPCIKLDHLSWPYPCCSNRI